MHAPLAHPSSARSYPSKCTGSSSTRNSSVACSSRASAGPGQGSTFRVTLPVAEIGAAPVSHVTQKEVDHPAQQAA